MPYRHAPGAPRRRTATITSTPTSTISARWSTWSVDPRRGLALGVDPLGGAGVPTGARSPSATGCLDGRERRRRSDVPLHDAWTGTARSAWTARRRMPWRRLIALKDRFDVAFACDTDHDRHGIVTPQRRAAEPEPLPGGRDLLSVSPPARMARRARRRQDRGEQQHDRSRRRRSSAGALVEVPVGFKWFVDGLLDGSLGFGGEESAGASFLRMDGTVWTTDKDGIDPGAARRGDHGADGPRSGRALRDLTRELGDPRLRAHRRAGDAASRKRSLSTALAAAGAGRGAGRRADRRRC